MISEIPFSKMPVLCKSIGFDFFIIDCEHGSFDLFRAGGHHYGRRPLRNRVHRPPREQLPQGHNKVYGHGSRGSAAFGKDRSETAETLANWIFTRKAPSITLIFLDILIELDDGHLAMLFRMDGAGYLWRVDSYDYGETWQKPFITDIPNPANKPFLIKTSRGEIVLLNTPESTRGLTERYPLEIWVSADIMRTWYKRIKLCDFLVYIHILQVLGKMITMYALLLSLIGTMFIMLTVI